MKKLLILLTLITLSCSNDDISECKCKGEFKIFGGDINNSFYVDNVDCDGSNYIERYYSFETPYYFVKCVEYKKTISEWQEKSIGIKN